MRRAAANAAVVALVSMPGAVAVGETSGNVTVLKVNAATLKNAYTKKKLTAVAGKVSARWVGSTPAPLRLNSLKRAAADPGSTTNA